MRYLNEDPPSSRRVKVKDRQDVGIVVDPGKNIGSGPAGALYCLGIHFPETGEVKYYVQSAVDDV